jgi:hypothetical protein
LRKIFEFLVGLWRCRYLRVCFLYLSGAIYILFPLLSVGVDASPSDNCLTAVQAAFDFSLENVLLYFGLIGHSDLLSCSDSLLGAVPL